MTEPDEMGRQVVDKGWSLSGNKLRFSYRGTTTFWDVPDDFTMPRESVRSLAEYILLTPYGETVSLVPGQHKPQGRVAVAFSGGVDSTAALELMPDPLPIYTRVSRVTGFHKLDNALLSVAEVGGVAVESNYDEFPVMFGRRRGFYGAAGFTVTSVIFSDYYNIGTICDGNVLESAYLWSRDGHGTRFQIVDRSHMFNAFDAVGLHYCMPCAGLTEVSTTRLSQGYTYSMGCMRGTNGNPCNQCRKCFRKNALRGSPIPTNDEVDKRLSLPLIRMLPSLLWAREHRNLKHAAINGITKDIAWVDKWYPRSLEYVPAWLHNHLRRRLAHFGIAAIEDVSALETWVSCDRAVER